MKRKKLSQIILIVSVVGVILTNISLANIYKKDVVINDVYGNRSALGEMNILIQKTGGVFETDSILISKDNERISKFVKQGDQLLNLTKENIDNRNMLQFEHNQNNLFEDTNVIGMVNVSESTFIDDKERMGAEIKIKDKKSGKVENYEIDMGNPMNITSNYRYASLPVKKEGDIIYLAYMYSYFDYKSDKEYVDDSRLLPQYGKSTTLSLYKLNLSDKTSKLIVSKEYDGKDISLQDEILSYGYKAYFAVNKKDDKSDNYMTNLLEFNIKTKDINFVNLGVKDDYITKACTLENNEILLLATHLDDGYVTAMNENIKGILFDLKNNKVKKTYELDAQYELAPIYTNRVRVSDGKIYVLSAGYIDREEYGHSYDVPYTFFVYDKTNGKKLYEGNVKINSSYRVNMGIVTNDEIE